MSCHQCGIVPPPGAKFCPDCGAALTKAPDQIRPLGAEQRAEIRDVPPERHGQQRPASKKPNSSEGNDPGIVLRALTLSLLAVVPGFLLFLLFMVLGFEMLAGYTQVVYGVLFCVGWFGLALYMIFNQG